MLKNKKYSGFTLVEMLIVMGILIILMAIGVAVGRFAIQRANNIQHNNAAEQLGQAMAAYYVENRKYPSIAEMSNSQFGTGADEALDVFIDADFDGGGDATYYYFVDASRQSYLICVSYGGLRDESNLGGFCTGNGFGSLPTSSPINSKNLDETQFDAIDASTSGRKVNWEDKGWAGDQN